jgi:hypothetical protein
MIIDDHFSKSLGERLTPYSGREHTGVFLKDQIYYKIWDFYCPALYEQVGLDFIWCGAKTPAAILRGLITYETCCVFKELLHNKGMCVGYSMYAGNHIKEKDEKYYQFIKKLVDVSVKTGYFFYDVKLENIVEYQGQLSLIDIDFSPIKIHHNKELSTPDYERWVCTIGNSSGLEYFEQMKKLYLDKN